VDVDEAADEFVNVQVVAPTRTVTVAAREGCGCLFGFGIGRGGGSGTNAALVFFIGFVQRGMRFAELWPIRGAGGLRLY
jgi:hypothetical protein